MSYTEFHKGKFKIVARGDEAIKKYIKDNNLEERLELVIDEKTGKIEYVEDNEPYNGDVWDREYHMITYREYMKDVDKTIDNSDRYKHNPNAENLLIKYLEHEHFGLDDGDIDIHKRISDDEFEFTVSFYNGGCCETEIYEDIINEVNLDEPFEEKKFSIKVCKDYQLNNMIYEFDRRAYFDGNRDMTFKSDYSVNFIEETVNQEQLLNYISKGYAIKINC